VFAAVLLIGMIALGSINSKLVSPVLLCLIALTAAFNVSAWLLDKWWLGQWRKRRRDQEIS